MSRINKSGINWKDKEEVKAYCQKHYKSIKYMHKKRFGGLRQQVLERDNYKCQLCGMTNEEHKAKWNRELTIDHINNNGRYSSHPDNVLDNLWTLCLRCHGKKDSIFGWIKRGKLFAQDIMNKYRLHGSF